MKFDIEALCGVCLQYSPGSRDAFREHDLFFVDVYPYACLGCWNVAVFSLSHKASSPPFPICWRYGACLLYFYLTHNKDASGDEIQALLAQYQIVHLQPNEAEEILDRRLDVTQAWVWNHCSISLRSPSRLRPPFNVGQTIPLPCGHGTSMQPNTSLLQRPHLHVILSKSAPSFFT